MKKKTKISISIDNNLYKKISELSKTYGFENPEEFLIHVIRKKIEEIESKEILKKRLRSLGYL